jgi:hypothetical protein
MKCLNELGEQCLNELCLPSHALWNVTLSCSEHFLTFGWIVLLPTSRSSSKKKRKFSFINTIVICFHFLCKNICRNIIIWKIRVYLRFLSCTKIKKDLPRLLRFSFFFLNHFTNTQKTRHKTYYRVFIFIIAICNFLSTRSPYYLANLADRQKRMTE